MPAVERGYRMRSGPPMRFRLPLLLLMFVALLGCDTYPRDPEATTRRVEGGVMRIGVIHDPPFVRSAGNDRPSGREIDLARAFARSFGARPVWLEGGQDRLLEDLEHFRLELVVGGVSPESPWNKRIALSLPYKVRDAQGRLVERVVSLPPGENAWQLRVEQFQRSPQGRAILETEILETEILEAKTPEGAPQAPAGAARATTDRR